MSEHKTNKEHWRSYEFDVQESGICKDVIPRNFEGQMQKNGEYTYMQPGDMGLYLPLTKPGKLMVMDAWVDGEISFVGANVLGTFLDDTPDTTKGIMANKHIIPVDASKPDFALEVFGEFIAPFHAAVKDRYVNEKYSYGLVKNWPLFYEAMLYKVILCDTLIWRPKVFDMWKSVYKNFPAQNDEEIDTSGFTAQVKELVGLNTYYLMTAYEPIHDPDTTPAIQNLREAFMQEYEIPFDHMGDHKITVSMNAELCRNVEMTVFITLKKFMLDFNKQCDAHGFPEQKVVIPSFFSQINENAKHPFEQEIYVPTDEELGYKY